MEFTTVLLLFAAGLICGVVNIIGGGGSLLSLPVLTALGLPAAVANGTNRIAVLMQDISALWVFKRKGELKTKDSLKLSLPVLIGSIAGTWLAARYLNDTLLYIIIIILSAGMTVTLYTSPSKWERSTDAISQGRMSFWQYLILFAIGIYGGFIQAGFTYLVMAFLVLSVGYSIVSSDAMKLFLNLMIIPVALGIFWWHGQINWTYGLILGVGSAIGGRIGVRFVSSWSPHITRTILTILLCLSGIYAVAKLFL